MATGDVLSEKSQEVLTLSGTLERLIRSTRRLLRSTWIATGLAVATGLFVATLVVVSLLDLAVPLWPVLRFVGFLLIVVPTAWVVYVGVARPLFRRLTQVMVARRIEQELPGIHNRLVSCVDLSSNGQQAHSQAFHHRLIREAYERVREFHPRRVLDLLSLRRAVVFALIALAAFGVSFFLFPDRLPTAMARIFQPFADIPPASGVLYEVRVGDAARPGDCDILRGEDVDFTVLLLKGEVDPPGGDDPLRLEIDTVDDEGARRKLRYDFPVVEGSETFFRLTGMQYSFTYRVFGGGTWSQEYAVTMLDRPRIVGLQTTLHYPEYMRIDEPRRGPPQSADVAGPVDSTVEITVDVAGDASEGEIQLLERRTRMIDVIDRPERVWFADEMPAGSKGHGTWEWNEELTGKRGHTDAAADGAHAHGFENAPVPFELLPDEILFADVWLPAEHIPETIMLKFHDGTNWEHRAYWGADRIGEGQPDTPSRFHAGDLPSAGRLIRLEVAAKDLGLEGKQIHGVSFAAFGGQAIWGSTGSTAPARRQITELAIQEKFLLHETRPKDAADPERPAQWSGTFELLKDGFYRVELRNRLSYPNQQMHEGKLTAIPDQPPQVVIERPVQDLVVSEPISVPVFISAYDDFGIDELTISLQMPNSNGFVGRPVREYERPRQSENAVVMLDLKKEGLQLDQTLRYRVEVRDAKGQSATTSDYTIRMANDNNAADQQFNQYQEKTESLQDKFEQLVQEQAKVEAMADELDAKYGSLTEAIEQAQAEAADNADPNAPPEQTPPLALDEESQKQLDALREELKQIAPIEEHALQLANEVAAEMKQVAEQSAQLDMLAPEIAEQMQGVQEAFEQLAVNPIQELKNLVSEATQPTQTNPQLSEIEAQSDEIMETLADLEERIDAVARAQELSRQNVEQAVSQLEQDILRQNAQLANRELMQLRDSIAEMREDLSELSEVQQELIADAQKDLSDPVFEALMDAQADFEGEAEPVLESAREVLESDAIADAREQAGTPFVPVLADASAEPENGDGENEPQQAEAAAPALSEVPERREFQERQLEQAEELVTAEAALAADQEILEDLIEGLSSQLPQDSLAELTPEQAAQLQQLLNAENTREALEMFRRLEQMLAQEGQPEPPEGQEPVPAELPASAQLAAIGNEVGVIGGVEEILVELEDFDLRARTVIMKMQPREREDLLQGLREEGPEGYRKFIRDYFKRLTKVQGTE